MTEVAATPEIKRERIEVPVGLSVDQIVNKFNLKRPAARRAKKKVSS